MINNMIKKIYFKTICVLTTPVVIYLEYFRHFKKIPKLSKPLKFCDKMQYIKLTENLEKYNQYVDKYKVRNHIKKTIGEQYLNKLLGVYDSFDEIDFRVLPSKFVLKCTHGSGYNIFCKDLSTFNIEDARNKINRWLKIDYYRLTRESQYKNIKPRIICEEFLEDNKGSLTEYKILCFQGKPKLLNVYSDINLTRKEDFYTENWEKINMKSYFNKILYDHSGVEMEKPKYLEELLEISKKLSNKFDFVRVDFYYDNEKIIFSELTFTPCSGFELYFPDAINYQLGSLLK